MSVTINGRRATMEEEQQLAVEMWEFVRVCQTDLCTGYDSASLKAKFVKMKRKCGIDIDWSEDCFLCNYTCSCLDCPLYDKENNKMCAQDKSAYDITMYPDDYQYYEIDEAIDKIINAIEVF